MNRRQFLQLTGATLLAGCDGARLPPLPPWLPVVIRRPGLAEGHWLRDLKSLPPSAGERRTGTLIIGGGVAGLMAAWRLRQSGYDDFLLLAGPEPGGNANGGQWRDVPYPRGAHYLPLPTVESTHVRQLLHELGMIESDPGGLRPRYDERLLLHASAERLLVDGRWQDGLHPSSVPAAEREQFRRFLAYVHGLKGRKGRDGRTLFAIPLALSSQDAEWRALDGLTLAQWLRAQGYTAPSLRWYLDYCCQDDFGLKAERVSAWAGLHYFASRNGQGHGADDEAVLTWPDGLQGLIRPMQAACAGQTLAGLALRVEERRHGVEVLYADRAFGRVMTVRAQRVICATPLHVTARLLPSLRDYGFDTRDDLPPHAPWLVGNVWLEGFPEERPGEELAWDNVVYGSRGQGFVVATHQLLRAAKPERTVLTAYAALAEQSPEAMRRWAAGASEGELVGRVLEDVAAAYGTRVWRQARGVEVTVRGHGMAGPVPGFQGNKGLLALQQADGRVLFAHSDLSGYSVFEEAAWWGERGAMRVVG